MAPATCKHRTGDAAFIKGQNADRERIVCGIGLDIQLELQVMAPETGAYEQRYQPFNPRFGASAPYPYTGKIPDESVHEQYKDDPIELGRHIEKLTPYDVALYAKKDPRLLTKTVVVRDYQCKIPIDLADTQKIAKAVLNHYPDQYVAFLGEFVSNLFGVSMKKFLGVQVAGYQKMLERQEMLNRVSWGAYVAVQGGVDMDECPAGMTGFFALQRDSFFKGRELKDMGGASNTPNFDREVMKCAQGDVTLRWSNDISNALGGLTREGRAMTGQCSSQDVFDLRPCINQHIDTLNRMMNEFCRGFGTKEEHVLLMLWYANEQGRKLGHDLRLMSESETPDYNKVTMQIPVNLFQSSCEGEKVEDMQPDLNPSIRSNLKEPSRECWWTNTVEYPVGNWSGSSDTVSTFLKTSQHAPYQWGWGHVANMGMLHGQPYDRDRMAGLPPLVNFLKGVPFTRWLTYLGAPLRITDCCDPFWFNEFGVAPTVAAGSTEKQVDAYIQMANAFTALQHAHGMAFVARVPPVTDSDAVRMRVYTYLMAVIDFLSVKGGTVLTAPHLRYIKESYEDHEKQKHSKLTYDKGVGFGRAYIDTKKWGPTFRRPTDKGALDSGMPAGSVPRNTGLRESLDRQPDPHPFRGAHNGNYNDEDVLYRQAFLQNVATAVDPAPPKQPIRTDLGRNSSIPCETDDGVNVFNRDIMTDECVGTIDPWLKTKECIRYDGGLNVPTRLVGPFDMSNMEQNSTIVSFLGSVKDVITSSVDVKKQKSSLLNYSLKRLDDPQWRFRQEDINVSLLAQYTTNAVLVAFGGFVGGIPEEFAHEIATNSIQNNISPIPIPVTFRPAIHLGRHWDDRDSLERRAKEIYARYYLCKLNSNSYTEAMYNLDPNAFDAGNRFVNYEAARRLFGETDIEHLLLPLFEVAGRAIKKGYLILTPPTPVPAFPVGGAPPTPQTRDYADLIDYEISFQDIVASLNKTSWGVLCIDRGSFGKAMSIGKEMDDIDEQQGVVCLQKLGWLYRLLRRACVAGHFSGDWPDYGSADSNFISQIISPIAPAPPAPNVLKIVLDSNKRGYKRALFQILMTDMLVKWVQDCHSGRGGVCECDITTYSQFNLVMRMSEPVIASTNSIRTIQLAYTNSLQMKNKWPVRLLFPGNQGGQGSSFPFLTRTGDFEDWSLRMPSNLIDASKMKGSSISIANKVQHGLSSIEIAEQILSLRLVIQNSMGMFAAALFFINPLDNPFVKLEDNSSLSFPDIRNCAFDQERGDFIVSVWNTVWGNHSDWKGVFKYNSITRRVEMYDSAVSTVSWDEETSLIEIYTRVHESILKKIGIMKGSDIERKRVMATRLAMHVADHVYINDFEKESPTWLEVMRKNVKGIPPEMMFQESTPPSLDRMAALTSDWSSYKKQWTGLPTECRNFLKALRMLSCTENTRTGGEVCILPDFLIDDYVRVMNHPNPDRSVNAVNPQRMKKLEVDEYGFPSTLTYFEDLTGPNRYPSSDRVAVSNLIIPDEYPVPIGGAAPVPKNYNTLVPPPINYDTKRKEHTFREIKKREDDDLLLLTPAAVLNRRRVQDWSRQVAIGGPPIPLNSRNTLDMAYFELYNSANEIVPSNFMKNMKGWWDWIIEDVFESRSGAVANLLGNVYTGVKHEHRYGRQTTGRAPTVDINADATEAIGQTAVGYVPVVPVAGSGSLRERLAPRVIVPAPMPLSAGGGPPGGPPPPIGPDKCEEHVSRLNIPKLCRDNAGPPVVGPGSQDPVHCVNYPISEEMRKYYDEQFSETLVRGGMTLSSKYANSTGTGDTASEVPRFVCNPVSGADYNDIEKPEYANLKYNCNLERPQFFACLDAASLLWHGREFFNPADANRPTHYERGGPDSSHPWVKGMAESFYRARELYRSKEENMLYEVEVKKNPSSTFPTSVLGAMCDDSWSRYFPLLPKDHSLREDLRLVRSLDMMWGTLPAYNGNAFGGNGNGAWMPLSVSHHCRLLDSVGLFDTKYHVPRNPWLAHDGHGISRIFNQSYHSVYHTDSYRAPHFKEWLKHANRYQPPKKDCYYPFSQYGGTPVEADFTHHRVEAPGKGVEGRHNQIMYNRFGFYKPLRIGQQFHDTGILQDMYNFEYRSYADLSVDQRRMKGATAVYPSNFLSYARNHAIIALASANHGTEEGSVPRIVRNLYRLYVDTYECMGANPDDDGVPAIMGFLPSPIARKDDRPIILYAGSLSCLNTKLERFCNSGDNKDEKVCSIYKQTYLNDAALLFSRLLRAERRNSLHKTNFARAMVKRQGNYSWGKFQGDLIDLQDAYIDFLQTTMIGMLLENGADLNGAPLHLLEPRELEVSLLEEDDNLVGNDYLTPATMQIMKNLDFGGDNLSRTQMAILSLIPPNHRILGTLRLNHSTEIIDLEHAKREIQKETISSNKQVWKRYADAMIGAAIGRELLEVDGPIDFGYDMTAVQDPGKFDMKAFKNPVYESENIRSQFATQPSQSASSISQNVRSQMLRRDNGPRSVLAMNSEERMQALQIVRDRVERDYQRQGRTIPRAKCLAILKIPDHVRRILMPEYT